jgi:hypothetical protein
MRRALGGRIALGAALGAALLAAQALHAGSADDDLAVVKHAVTRSAAPQPGPARAVDGPTGPRAAHPQWLRVRVVEKGSKRVSINVPLGLVRVLKDMPVDWGCHNERRACRLRLGEILQALDSGQSLVEVNDEDGTRVRVWVE